jgi:hypothetical protein
MEPSICAASLLVLERQSLPRDLAHRFVYRKNDFVGS